MPTPPAEIGGALRRAARRLRRRFRPSPLALVYSTQYEVDLPGWDALRGERILAFLDEAGLLARHQVHRTQPASLRDLLRVHTDAYLTSLDDPATLLPILGLELPVRAIDRILAAQRTMVGGTALAVRLALDHQGVAWNLGGGLHHAFAARGERLCLFNDVAVAIAGLRAEGWQAAILVVDLDLHDGDGTRSIFAVDSTVHTFSIHNRTTGGPAVEATVIELGDAVSDAEYLAVLDRELPPVIERFRPELVLYLAGTDVAEDDGLGNWKLTAQGILDRDQRVFDWVRRSPRPLPLAVVLGGGYGQESWRYSARSLSAEFQGGRPIEPPTTTAATLARYRQFASTLDQEQLSGDAGGGDWGLSADDLSGAALGGVERPPRFLAFYSPQGLELALERAGLLERLRTLGYREPSIELELGNPAGDLLRVWGNADHQELLAELRARLDRSAVPHASMLRIEWLRLQNPRAQFPPGRTALPGQNHPGLGMLRDVVALLLVACDRLHLDGVVFVPARFHIAAQARNALRFLSPEDEGRFRALQAVLSGLPLAAAVRAVEDGRIRDAHGAVFTWQPASVVIPVSAELRRRLESDEYEHEAARVEEGLHLTLLPEPGAPTAPA